MNSTRPLLFICSVVVSLIVFAGYPMVSQAAFGDTSVYAGHIIYGNDQFRTTAYFDFPEDIISDGAGNFYIADTANNAIRKIDNNGFVRAIAGTGSFGDKTGKANDAVFSHPAAVASEGSALYVADAGNGKIKKILNGNVTTIADDFGRPEGLAVRSSKLYVTDYAANTLTVMNLDGSNKRVITSNLSAPKKVYVRSASDYAYITNSKDYTVVKVNISTGAVSVVAGIKNSSGKTNGGCSSAQFRNLWGITVNEGASISADDIYVTDGTGDGGNIVDRDATIINTSDAGKVKVIDQDGSDLPEDTGDEAGGILTAGSCGVYVLIKDSEAVAINYPNSLTLYDGNLYVAVTGISQILKVNVNDPTQTEWFAGKDRFHNRNGKDGLPGRPKALVISKDGKRIYYTENNKVKYITTADKKIHALVGNTIDNYARNDDRTFSGEDGRFSDTLSLALHPDQKRLFVIDRNNNRIRLVNISEGSAAYFTGAGIINSGGTNNGYAEGAACPNTFDLKVKGCAYFNRPGGMVIDRKGKYAYVADTGNQVIRRVTLEGVNAGTTKFIAGKPGESGFTDGKGTAAKFNVPISITIDTKDEFLYVADRNNHAIRKVSIATGAVTTVAGKPTRSGYLDAKFADAYLNLPVAVYFNDNHIFFTEAGTHRVRVADLDDGVIKLVAGDGKRGYVDGNREHSEFDNPVGMLRKGNNLLVADSINDLIRKIDLGDGDTIPFTLASPTITRVDPTFKVKSTSAANQPLRLIGTNFRHGAQVFFGTYAATTYVNSSTELTVVIPLSKMPTGNYDVTVYNSDGQKVVKQSAFSVQ